MGLDQDKELIALIDLVIDGVKDGVAVAEGGGLSVVNLVKFSNLLPELIPAFAGIGLVPAEIKALTFADDEAVVLHVVDRLGVTNTKAISIIQSVLKLAADAYDLVQTIKKPA